MPVMKWHEGLIVDVAVLASNGVNHDGIRAALDIDSNTYARWRRKYPLFEAAIEKGFADAKAKRKAQQAQPQESFGDYVYNRLDGKLKELWDQLIAIDKHPNALQQTNQLLADEGVRVRQALFVHAMCAATWNQSDACRMVGITRKTLEAWQGDPVFAELISEVWWHRRNFFEGALVAQVARGDVAAIIFANRTINKDRGYGDSVKVTGGLDVNSTAKVDVRVQHVPHETLSLIPLDVRKAMLEQMLAQQGVQAGQQVAGALVGQRVLEVAAG